MDGNYRENFNNFAFGSPMEGGGGNGPPPLIPPGMMEDVGGPPTGPIGNASQRQVQMWQEQNYMQHESGFISASTTQPSSVTGHEEMEDGCYTGPGSIVSGSLYDLDSGAQSGKIIKYFS